MSTIDEFLKAGYHEVEDATYPGTFCFIKYSKITSTDQYFNRGSKKWNKAAVIVTEDTPNNSERVLLLTRWKDITVFHDQVLWVLEADGTYTVYDHQSNLIKNGAAKDLLEIISIDLTPIILYGPPGTGKTFTLQNQYFNRYGAQDRFFVTFHQSYSYEDFIIGIKPSLSTSQSSPNSSFNNNTNAGNTNTITYALQKGVFYDACDQAARKAGYQDLQDCLKDTPISRERKIRDAINKNDLVLFCIDEINRANVSAVLGDLISLMEVSKRLGAKHEMICTLPYKENGIPVPFGVPLNLVIVGAMNTADRSIQLLDSALRRRFRFKELLPDYDRINNTNAKKVLMAINARIRYLLDKDHQIGHTYLMNCTNDLGIFHVLTDRIIPLLEEYFYNDAQKIRIVLNETLPSGGFYFYEEDSDATISHSSEFYDADKTLYKLKTIIGVTDDQTALNYIQHIF